jgi:tripartite-type tricarboxylate transporter receptor subunit TctC
MKRQLFICLLAGVALATNVAHAQHQNNSTYPTRQVRVVVPYPAGGPTDLVARLLAQKLTERMGQSFYVENAPGRVAQLKPVKWQRPRRTGTPCLSLLTILLSLR